MSFFAEGKYCTETLWSGRTGSGLDEAWRGTLLGETPFTTSARYEDMVKKQARTPAPPLRTPLLIMIILEDNYPAICRRDSPEEAFSRSRLAASLCEQGQWSRERRQAGMQRGAGGPSPEWPGSLGDLRHRGLCCLHNPHTHTGLASRMRSPFFFFSLSVCSWSIWSLCAWAVCCCEGLAMIKTLFSRVMLSCCILGKGSGV